MPTSPGSRRTASSRKPIVPPPQPTFSRDDLIAALSERSIGDGLTRCEIRTKTGRSISWVNARITELAAAGKLEWGKAPRADLFGHLRYQPVYRLKSA